MITILSIARVIFGAQSYGACAQTKDPLLDLLFWMIHRIHGPSDGKGGDVSELVSKNKHALPSLKLTVRP